MTLRSVVAATCLLVLVSSNPALAAPGDLDTSFSGDGVVHTDVSSDRTVTDTAFGVAVQDDGGIVAIGRASGSGGRFALVRYEPDGTLDPDFGLGGKVRTDLTPGADAAFGVAVQPDGKIVVVGRAGPSSGGAFALARYEADGTLDATLRGDGTVITRFDDGAAASSVALDADGRIVTAGRVGPAFAVVRYLQNGRLDVSFGNDGTVLTDFGPGRESAAALSIDVNGAIIAAGTAGLRASGAGDSMFAVARYTADGDPDATLGGDGSLTVELSSAGDIAHGVATDPAHRIVIVGTTGVGAIDPDTRSAVVRLETDGTFDPTFSDDGVRAMNVTNRPDVATAVGLQSDGKVVVSGTSRGVGRCCPSKAWLLRYSAAGRPDQTFEGGEVVTDPDDVRAARAVAVQPDGRIVLAGLAVDRGSRFAVLRYLGA